MAHIDPFRALRYDQSRVSLNDTITQPYDKITSEMQEKYYAASPYNLVRIILGKRQPTDRPGDDPARLVRVIGPRVGNDPVNQVPRDRQHDH